MSELHKFVFDGLPVRGSIVRLSDAWAEVLRRRAANRSTGAYPEPVRAILGQTLAAAALMQSSIQFDGTLVLQLLGDGAVPLLVAEVGPELTVRATATVRHPLPGAGGLADLVNAHGQARCVITLDPRQRRPAQQPYQGVVPLADDSGRRFDSISQALTHYLRQSEQIDSCLVLAADGAVAAGLLIQRLPELGAANLAGSHLARDDDPGAEDAFARIALLAATLTAPELLTLDVDSVLHRLFWQEPLRRFEPLVGKRGPRFACSCSRERVARMIEGLGAEEALAIVAERGDIEVICEFCGAQYAFDAVDAAALFAATGQLAPGGSGAH